MLALGYAANIGEHWCRTTKFDPACAALADRHYSRRTIGSPQFMPPGETIILRNAEGTAVWGWWRPHPRSGMKLMSGLDGWTCSIFRNESDILSSTLVLEAEVALRGRTCGPDGMLTYVWRAKVSSENPGYCFKVAGWRRIGRSADGKKDLLQKPCYTATTEPEARKRSGLHASTDRRSDARED